MKVVQLFVFSRLSLDQPNDVYIVLSNSFYYNWAEAWV